MVEGMQECQGLFLEYQEDSVDELDIFDDVVDLLAARRGAALVSVKMFD